MRSTAVFGAALAAFLASFQCALAQSCPDDGNKLLRTFGDAKSALQSKGCSELGAFISARTQFADFLDAAKANGCSDMYVDLNRIIVSETYNNPPADCVDAWKAKGDNRQLQYDAIAVINRDLGRSVFIDGNAVVLRQRFWHDGNHTVKLGADKCRVNHPDAASAIRCAVGGEKSEFSTYSFDVTLIDPQRIDVSAKSALTVQIGDSAATPQELVKSLTRKGTTSDATRVVLHCLPDKPCVHALGGDFVMNLVQLDPETNCNDVLSHVVDVLAMMRRAPH